MYGVSPSKRTQQTFQYLFSTKSLNSGLTIKANTITLTEDITKWLYGDYEGLRLTA